MRHLFKKSLKSFDLGWVGDGGEKMWLRVGSEVGERRQGLAWGGELEWENEVGSGRMNGCK